MRVFCTAERSVSLLADCGQFPKARLETGGSLGRGDRMASRRAALTPCAVSVGLRGQESVCPKERREMALVRAPDLEPDFTERHVGLGQ